MFVEEKLKATPVVDSYFGALQQRDVTAALATVRLGDGGPSEATVRESIEKTLAQLGTPVAWNETNFRSFGGTGGNSVELQYNVTYSDAPSVPVQETFQLRSANGSPYTIYRHGMLANPLK